MSQVTFEARLESIDNTLKAILTALQSGQQMMTTLESTAADTTEAPKRGRKPKAETTVEKTPEAPRHWVSETLRQVYVQAEGAPAPEDQSFKLESAEHAAARAAEFAKPAPVAETPVGNAAPAATPPASSAPVSAQAAVPVAASTAGEPTWDEVIKKLMFLKDNHPNGAAAVLALIKKVDPAAANVPGIKGKKPNAEIIAMVDAELAPAGDEALFG